MDKPTARFKTESLFTLGGPPEADFVWSFYSMGRQNFIAQHPELYEGQSGLVVPTFEEELAGRFMLVDGTAGCVNQGKQPPSPYLADLLRVHQAGFLKEYVWSYCNRHSWPDAERPGKLLSFIPWARANLRTHTLETRGGVRIVREGSFSGQTAGRNSQTVDVRHVGGRELNPMVAQINAAVQCGNFAEAGRLLATFNQSAKNLRKETDAAYRCFMSQRQLDYFLLLHSEPLKVRVMDGSVALGSFQNAFVLSHSGRFTEALSELEDVLKLAPFFARGWHEKGYILMNLRRPHEALTANRHAWKLVLRHPENFDPAGPILRAQSVAFVELGDLDRAEKLLSDSLVVEPGNTVAMRELAYIAQRRKGGVVHTTMMGSLTHRQFPSQPD